MLQLGRLWRTVRHLKPQQIIGRVRFRFARPSLDLSAAPPVRRIMAAGWQKPARRRPSILSTDTFLFLNEKGSLSEHGWDSPEKSKLWRYNQHYFDDLCAQDSEQRVEWHCQLILRWIAENPSARGSGWEPYPSSLRIVNWIKWSLSANALPDQAHHSLAVQTRWLSKRLEFHLLGNHLFVNAKALIFAGLFFSGDEADKWLQTGLNIIREQMPEQILEDGGQFELSPMYHAFALEDILDLINITRAFDRSDLATEFEMYVPAMLKWLLALSHSDGEIAFFNDAAIRIAPDNAELLRYVEDLGFVIEPPADGLTHHVQSGYVRMELGAAIVIADLARIGPDYLPGHAHADTLSFELSLAGKRFVVNSGTSEYGTGPERQRQRGTAAHSTMVIDGENSSEVWSGFRVGRRAKPFDVAVCGDENSMTAHGAHDGYTHLPGSPVHRRKWCLSEGRLFVEDAVAGSGVHQLEAYFHLGRGINAVADTGNNVVELTEIESGCQATFSAEGGLVEVMPSSWHPEFGLRIETTMIRVSAHRALPHALRYLLTWSAQ